MNLPNAFQAGAPPPSSEASTQKREAMLDEALEQSFPASDPVAMTAP